MRAKLALAGFIEEIRSELIAHGREIWRQAIAERGGHCMTHSCVLKCGVSLWLSITFSVI